MTISAVIRRAYQVVVCAGILCGIAAQAHAQLVPADSSVPPETETAAVFCSPGAFGCPVNFNAEIPADPNASTPQASSADNNNDWLHKWLKTVDETREKQPHYVAPLITTHVLLVQQFRFDSYYQE